MSCLLDRVWSLGEDERWRRDVDCNRDHWVEDNVCVCCSDVCVCALNIARGLLSLCDHVYIFIYICLSRMWSMRVVLRYLWWYLLTRILYMRKTCAKVSSRGLVALDRVIEKTHTRQHHLTRKRERGCADVGHTRQDTDRGLPGRGWHHRTCHPTSTSPHHQHHIIFALSHSSRSVISVKMWARRQTILHDSTFFLVINVERGRKKKKKKTLTTQVLCKQTLHWIYYKNIQLEHVCWTQSIQEYM